MSLLRARLSAIVIAATMLATGAAPFLANGPDHRACIAHQHDCRSSARLTGCCAIEPADRSHETTPPAGKTQLAQPVADRTEMMIDSALARPGLVRVGRESTRCPRCSPPDLITLFGTFLI